MEQHLPVFRRMIKAIGDKDFKNTAYRYKLVEFLPTGGFIRKDKVWIGDTKMRGPKRKTNVDRLYEAQIAGIWHLISAEEFAQYKVIWDARRVILGHTPVDEFGNDVN